MVGTLVGLLVLSAALAAQPVLGSRALERRPTTASEHADVTPTQRSTSHGSTRRRPPRRRRSVPATMLVALAVVAIVALTGPIALAGTIAAAAAWRRLRPLRAERRRRHRIEVDLPDTIDLFVLAVRSGLTPRLAVEQLSMRAPRSVRSAFAAVVDRLHRGAPFADALTALDDLLGTPAVALSGLVASADRHGLPLGPILDQLSAESRSSRRRQAEAAARALPVKLSFPLVICTLPSFVLLAIVPAVLAALSSLGSDAW